MKINGHTYGEFISMDNVRIELHMSKRRLAYLLQNGYIPCEIRNSATWRYKIRTKDVVAYIKSGISPDIPPGVFKRKPQAEVERIKFNKKKLKELFKEIVSFVGCRLVTAVVEVVMMMVTVGFWKWNSILMKIITNIVVMILNFVFSKIIIFKKGNKKDEEKNA